MAAALEHRFQKATTKRSPDNGPAHICKTKSWLTKQTRTHGWLSIKSHRKGCKRTREQDLFATIWSWNINFPSLNPKWIYKRPNKDVVHLDFLALHNLKSWLKDKMKIESKRIHLGLQQSPPYCLKVRRFLWSCFLHHNQSKEGPGDLGSSVWACEGQQNQNERNLKDNQEETNGKWSTFIKAHILKWALYSWKVMPPLPTSNISGSAQSDKMENKKVRLIQLAVVIPALFTI